VIHFVFVFYVNTFDAKILFLLKFVKELAIVFVGPVTKIENIKTDATKILRPTHFGE
jgi:hypothetical protein